MSAGGSTARLGGLAAGLLFVLPGAFVVLALSIAYALYGQVPLVEAAFVGIKAAVLVIVIEALLRVARRALRGPAHWVIAGAAFVAIFFFDVPFPLVIAGAALAGYVLAATKATAPPEPQGKIPAVPLAQHAAHGKSVARDLDPAARSSSPSSSAATMSSPTSPSSSRSSPSSPSAAPIRCSPTWRSRRSRLMAG